MKKGEIKEEAVEVGGEGGRGGGGGGEEGEGGGVTSHVC